MTAAPSREASEVIFVLRDRSYAEGTLKAEQQRDGRGWEARATGDAGRSHGKRISITGQETTSHRATQGAQPSGEFSGSADGDMGRQG